MAFSYSLILSAFIGGAILGLMTKRTWLAASLPALIPIGAIALALEGPGRWESLLYLSPFLPVIGAFYAAIALAGAVLARRLFAPAADQAVIDDQ